MNVSEASEAPYQNDYMQTGDTAELQDKANSKTRKLKVYTNKQCDFQKGDKDCERLGI